MNDSFDPVLEAKAEAVAFAHEPDRGPMAAIPDTEQASFERAAALVAAALAGSGSPPPSVRQRLASAAFSFCAERAAQREQPVAARPRTLPGPWRASGWRGFVLGAAAAAAVAFVWTQLSVPGPSSGEPVSPYAARERLVQEDVKVVRVEWKGGPSPFAGTVRGDVVWSQDRQVGYLRFTGLPPLDPGHRFQLWIVDGQRTGAPVDGGLFAISDPDVETVVPVQAALPIGKPAAFVVTVEDARGVVVSGQEHVVAIAGL